MLWISIALCFFCTSRQKNISARVTAMLFEIFSRQANSSGQRSSLYGSDLSWTKMFHAGRHFAFLQDRSACVQPPGGAAARSAISGWQKKGWKVYTTIISFSAINLINSVTCMWKSNCVSCEDSLKVVSYMEKQIQGQGQQVWADFSTIMWLNTDAYITIHYIVEGPACPW